MTIRPYPSREVALSSLLHRRIVAGGGAPPALHACGAALSAIVLTMPRVPFDPTGDVVGRLAFVHQQVTAHTSCYARL